MRSDAQENRDKILRAARHTFVNEGPDAPLDEIARRAGVGVATLYRRFPSREELVHAVAADTLERLHAAARTAAEREPNPFEALRRFLHAALELKIGAVLPSLFGRIDLERVVSEVRDALEPLTELLSQAQSAALVRSDIVAGDAIFMIMRLTRPLPGARVPEDGAIAHRQLEIYLDGLRPSAAWPREEPLPGPAVGPGWFRRIRERMAGRPAH